MRTWLVLGLVALAACTARREDDGIDIDPISDRIGDWETNLSARNNSGVTGSSTVRSAAAGAQASISIRGATANSHHPWHVHRGGCGSGGAIVGDASAYPTLHVAANGTASASATISPALSEDQSYHVNVHRSPTELNVIIACGNLSH